MQSEPLRPSNARLTLQFILGVVVRSGASALGWSNEWNSKTTGTLAASIVVVPMAKFFVASFFLGRHQLTGVGIGLLASIPLEAILFCGGILRFLNNCGLAV